ncbi:MAG: cupin domain-containing protein [Chloroflexota bacterium]
MTTHHLGPFEGVPNRPGRRARNLVGTEHGFDSVFVTENEMDPGSFIPRHVHPVEEAWVVMEGDLVVEVGDDTLVAAPGSIVRVPPDIPHAVRNEGTVTVRAITAAPWDRASFFSHATTYLEGLPAYDAPSEDAP